MTHRWLGIPFFLAMMYVIFHLVQNVSTPYLDWVDGVINGPVARHQRAVKPAPCTRMAAAKEVVVSTLAQIYAPQAPAASPRAASARAELLGIATGLGDATVQAGRSLLSLVPGLNDLGPATPAADTAWSRALRQHFTPLSGLSYLVFVLLYVPCAATLGAIKAEFGWRWAAFSALYQTGIAYLAAVLVFQTGRLAGFA